MRSREVVCYACNHQFRENCISDDCWIVRSKSGKRLEVDVAGCPKCGKSMYISHDSLKGLDPDQFEVIRMVLS